jgi:GntR family transcriptional regulator/MocR family aminotransferase
MTWTRVSIERGTGKPLYRQLREALEHEIAIGALDPALPLPSSRELARELGVSRNTVNTAYLELESEGFVDARPRQGLFVNQEMLSELNSGAERPPAAPVDWSGHLNELPDSGVPEIAKIRDWDRYPYPFVAGQVDSSSFPRLPWARALREALDPPHLHYSLRDGIDEDDPMLLEELCRRVLPARGIEVEPDHVLITLGSQQGLDLLAHTLVRPGSAVGVEDPGYPDARHIFLRAGATLRPLAVDGQGLMPEEDALRDLSLVHLTPSHHSPTNVTLSIARRRQLLAMAAQHDTLLVEDDYDSEFRYQGSPTPAMKALPDSERVIYLGTFSKFLAPGLRLGYLVADPELVRELRRQRRYRVRHAAGHLQRAMALLIASGHYHRTVRRRRTNLAQRWNVLRTSLNEYLPWQVDTPPGGVSIWLPGPPELDCVELAGCALERGAVIERGDVYFSEAAAHRNYLRLGFAAIAPEAITPGVKILAELITEQLAQRSAGPGTS